MRNKFNITENDEALSYYQNQTFTFNAAASKPHKEDDVITVAHLPLMVILFTILMLFLFNLSQTFTCKFTTLSCIEKFFKKTNSSRARAILCVAKN